MPLAELGDLTLHYDSRGEGDPPVLGIMGFALDSRFWAGQIPTITEHHRFITYDNRGVGRSPGDAPTSMDEMAGDAIALLDHLEIDKAVVMGISMGGAVAQRLVLEHPDRVEALILAITFARPIEFMRRQHAAARRIIETLGPDFLTDVTLLRMFTPEFFEVGGDMIDRLVRVFREEGSDQNTATLLAQLDALDKHDCLDQLSAVTCPTLVIGSRWDQMVPGLGSEEIAAAVPGSRLVMFDSGHGVSMEKMQEFNDAIGDFLAELR